MRGDELELKQKMDRTYLVQRLNKPTGHANPFSFGGGLANGGISREGMALLKGIFSFDYMGSAEFEWGAVPAALTFIASTKLTSGTYEGVHYICPVSYEEGVKEVIRALLDDENSLRLKERCGLKERISGSMYSKDNVGWLELDNGFFFFVDDTMFANTKKLFGVE